jgi:hypothetical protein
VADAVDKTGAAWDQDSQKVNEMAAALITCSKDIGPDAE